MVNDRLPGLADIRARGRSQTGRSRADLVVLHFEGPSGIQSTSAGSTSGGLGIHCDGNRSSSDAHESSLQTAICQPLPSGAPASLPLHATWNAWVKSRRDTTTAVACLVTGAGFPNLAVSVNAAHERRARPLRRAAGDDERYDRPRRDDEHEGG